ncbi:MAG TPA: nitroreductase family protein [Bacilli bacterium]|nr:nitroreductase family protein [Bacilli bacterium]
MTYLDALRSRRSNYDLTDKTSIPISELEDLLAQTLELSPTGFNSQSSRIVVLVEQKHQMFWDLVLAGIKKEIGDTPSFAKSQEKIANLRRSAGTILFYEDENVNDELKQRFPLYAHNIGLWSEQSQGMLQMSVWTLLADHGMGASLQHYSELVATPLAQALNIDPKWRLIGQMPFGVPASTPQPKSKIPGRHRLIIAK